MSTDLLPCPFCGGKAHTIQQIDGISGVVKYSVYCNSKCGVVAFYCDTESEAIAAWNTRAERTCKAVVDSQNGLVCSECGSSAVVRSWTEMHSWGGDYERVNFTTYNYCPNCGAKVKDE